MAQRLFAQMNTVGVFHTPAKFIPEWKSLADVAPSPKVGGGHDVFSSQPGRVGVTDGMGYLTGDGNRGDVHAVSMYVPIAIGKASPV